MNIPTPAAEASTPAAPPVEAILKVGKRKFRVPSDEIEDVGEKLAQIPEAKHADALAEAYEEVLPPISAGLYTWAAAHRDNAASLRLISALGLQARLGDSKVQAEVTGSTSRPIAYTKIDNVLTKNELSAAHEACIESLKHQIDEATKRAAEDDDIELDEDAVQNLKRQMRSLQDVFDKGDVYKRTYILGFHEEFVLPGEDGEIDEDNPETALGVIVGCYSYREPNPKRRGPEVREIPPEVLVNAFHRDGGLLAAFELPASAQEKSATILDNLLTYHQKQLEASGYFDDAFDNDLHEQVNLLGPDSEPVSSDEDTQSVELL